MRKQAAILGALTLRSKAVTLTDWHKVVRIPDVFQSSLVKAAPCRRTKCLLVNFVGFDGSG